MRRMIVLMSALLLLSGLSFAGTVTGYISDEGCARNGEARNPQCAKNCISGGAAAVLVTDQGEIYSISDQAKVKEFAGEMVALTGEIEGKKIKSVESASLCSESDLCEG